jgi:hypothetical protein
MPLLFGPLNSRYTYTGSLCPHNDLAYESKALTLGDALRDYEVKFNVSISPCTAPLPGETEVKYFLFKENFSDCFSYVDIHVFRGELEICPKYDMSFNLESTDLVEMGQLIC